MSKGFDRSTRARRAALPQLILTFLSIAWIASAAAQEPPPLSMRILRPTPAEQATTTVPLDFGTSVAISGSTAIVGMPNVRAPGAVRTGRVAVYTHNAQGHWQRTASIDPVNWRAGDSFGMSVATDGTLAVIYSDANVEVYRRSGSTWTWEASLVPAPATNFSATPASVTGSCSSACATGMTRYTRYRCGRASEACGVAIRRSSA